MSKASDNAFPSVLIEEGTEPTAPAAGHQRVYIDSTSHHLSRTDSGGTQVDLETTAGNVATDAIWDAAGDLAQGTGANTAARLALGVVGTVVRSTGTANAYAYPPGYEFDYAQITASGSPTATVEASSDTIITGHAVTYDGSTVVMVEFYCPDARPNDSAGAWVVVSLFEGATQLGRMCWMSLPTALAATVASQRQPLVGRFRLTPSAAAHTYHIKSHVSTGTGYIGAGAGGTGTLVPAFMRITKA